MKDDLKKKKDKLKKNGRRPQNKWKKNQSTKINLIGCDTIVNSPSFKFNPSDSVYRPLYELDFGRTLKCYDRKTHCRASKNLFWIQV